MATSVDYAQIRERVSLEQAVQYLHLTMKQDRGQLRSECPACRTGGDRALVVTPGKGYYCFAQKRGGNDSTALVAHVKQISQRDAALELQEHFRIAEAHSSPSPRAAEKRPGFDPDAFASKLVYSGEVEDMGFTEDDAARLGIGWHPLRKAVYLPVRNVDGSIAGFVGVLDGTAIKLPPQWLHINVVPLKARA